MTSRPPIHHRRGSTVVVAIWSVAITALVVAAIQLSAFRQSSIGREVLARTQARWAARAGVEYTIAVMADHTQFPDMTDAMALQRDLEAVHRGEVHHANWRIVNQAENYDRPYEGPLDEHAKLNINMAIERGLLGMFDNMSPAIEDAAADWVDENDEQRMMGVERDWYLSQPTPIEPRNGHLRSLAEFELIAGVWPKEFRGEDWNLNGRLDPNEDDGGLSWPDYDNADATMQGGLSTSLSAMSTTGGATHSGQPRIHLYRASVEDVMERFALGGFELNEDQAMRLVAFGRNPDNRIEQLISTPLSNIDASGAVSANGNDAIPPLEAEAIMWALAELQVQDPHDRMPGKMNINMVPYDLIRRLIEYLNMDPIIAEEIQGERTSRRGGYTSIYQLAEIQDLTTDEVVALAGLFDTMSSVYTISSIGVSPTSGQEVEIIAVVDRSTLPVTILEYREQ